MEHRGRGELGNQGQEASAYLIKFSHSQRFCFLNSFCFWKFSQSMAGVVEAKWYETCPHTGGLCLPAACNLHGRDAGKCIFFFYQGNQINKRPDFLNFSMAPLLWLEGHIRLRSQALINGIRCSHYLYTRDKRQAVPLATVFISFIWALVQLFF